MVVLTFFSPYGEVGGTIAGLTQRRVVKIGALVFDTPTSCQV